MWQYGKEAVVILRAVVRARSRVSGGIDFSKTLWSFNEKSHVGILDSVYESLNLFIHVNILLTELSI